MASVDNVVEIFDLGQIFLFMPNIFLGVHSSRPKLNSSQGLKCGPRPVRYKKTRRPTPLFKTPTPNPLACSCTYSNPPSVLYIQNTPNRYSAICVMNVLFANCHLREDAEFLKLVDEVVEDHIAQGLIGDEEKWENYLGRISIFSDEDVRGVLFARERGTHRTMAWSSPVVLVISSRHSSRSSVSVVFHVG